MSVIKVLRRAIGAVSGAAIIAALMRLRGKGGVPPQDGGWVELKGLDD